MLYLKFYCVSELFVGVKQEWKCRVGDLETGIVHLHQEEVDRSNQKTGVMNVGKEGTMLETVTDMQGNQGICASVTFLLI